ncbi:PIN domain-containing protein [Bacteroidales bacterium OttesenSCG-928-I21]|nr:PIN domain-containing protein [Bacteroidales bacterium OttesenSCG-928-I21]
MERLLIDTNIIVDLLAKRADFYQESQELFTLADEKNISLFISALTFANTHYILMRDLNAEEARKILIKFKTLVEILPLEDKILELALASDFNDFEDAIQYHTALDNRLDAIITRNKKDFKKSVLPVLTAREYLNK